MGDQVDVILLNFAKAFNKVPHSRLLYKLAYYGVSGKTNPWIKTFLSDRKQQVLLEGTHSYRADVLSGVPQGALLFLAYINGLPDSLRSSDARLFADDSLLYHKVNGAKDNALLQVDLSALGEWERILQMSFSTTICSVIRITTGRTKEGLPLILYAPWTKNLVDSSKYLGVKVTRDITGQATLLMLPAKPAYSSGK